MGMRILDACRGADIAVPEQVAVLGVDREYYRPVDRGFESELAQRLNAIRQTLRRAKETGDR
jgi:putative ATPase